MTQTNQEKKLKTPAPGKKLTAAQARAMANRQFGKALSKLAK
jgi:hypothetical protein